MVLEKIVSIEKVESNLLYGIAFGAIIALVGIFIGANIFPSDPSMAALFFIVIGAVPFFRKMLFLEEAEIERESKAQWIMSYKKIIRVFLAFYIGVALTYFILSLVNVPYIGAPQILFEKQLQVFSGFSGHFINAQAFNLILFNNLKVVLLTVALSLLYGAGAVLVLTWNASTLGVFFASLGKESLAFVPHATLEFLGFFSAAVAKKILSAAIEKHEYGTPTFTRVIKDVAFLFLLSIVLILAGALIESMLF